MTDGRDSFLNNAGDICRKDGIAFFAENTIWGILSQVMLLLAAAEVVKDFSQIRTSDCLVQ